MQFITTAVCSSGCHAVGGYCNNPGQCLYVFLVANNSSRPTSTQVFILINMADATVDGLDITVTHAHLGRDVVSSQY